MSDKTATERLRELLDERGVDYRVSATGYSIDIGPYTTAYANRSDTTLDVSLRQVTPEQAIAATLGSCNCSNSERTGTCEYCANGKFDGQTVMMSNHGWQRINFCPNCGKRIEVDDG